MKTDVKTVIELMGPGTPKIYNSSSVTSNMADNEDSCFSTETASRLAKLKEEVEEEQVSENEYTDHTVPPDVTLREDTDFSKIADKDSTAQDIPSNEFHYHRYQLEPQDTNPLESQYPQFICPPPPRPANILFSSECMCPQVANYINNLPEQQHNRLGKEETEKQIRKPKNIFTTLLKFMKEKKDLSFPDTCEYYTMNIKKSESHQGIPKRLVFELADDIHKCERTCFKESKNYVCYHATEKCKNENCKDLKNMNNEMLTKHDDLRDSIKKNMNQDKMTAYDDATKVDVYYFDHGNLRFLQTTDSPPKIHTERVAEKTEEYTTKFWAELFGTIHIGFSFFTSFILQFLRFVLYSILRPLLVGIIQLCSDYFFKPFLATIFNGIIQPVMAFLYNIALSIRDLFGPIAEAIGYFLREIANLIRAFRLVEVRNEKCQELYCKCSKCLRGRIRSSTH